MIPRSPSCNRLHVARITNSILSLLLLAVCSTVADAGMTYILLRGTGSNCLSVDPLPGSTIDIRYHLPDLKIKEDLVEGKILEEELNTEGMDEAEAALLQRQREVAIKRARQGKDVSIAISQRTPFPLPGAEPIKNPPPNVPRERPRNQREQPTEKEGSIVFETSQSGGPVQICVHSLFANKNGPYQVGLEITEQTDLSQEESDFIDAASAAAAKQRALQNEVTDTVLVHLSAFSKEMIRAENLVRTILASADVVKKEETEFYEQSQNMQRSVRFWPMFQLTCLLLAACLQVHHILKWMKVHHIV